MNFSTRLGKTELVTFVTIAFANLLVFIGLLTPNWQVAEDTDVHRTVSSGLWLYCPGAGQCWYIFSDDVVNYYEKVDVCRFLLIGDCRKKLLRTPYFFGWHYAVLVLVIISIILSDISLIGIALGHFKPKFRKIGTIILDSAISLSCLILGIALAVFVINAEMLESRYLIGVQNTFEVYIYFLILKIIHLENIWLFLLPCFIWFIYSCIRFIWCNYVHNISILFCRC